MKLKDIVKEGNTAVFDRYVDGNLWYRVKVWNEGRFNFPIPVEDTKGGVFNAV